MFIILIVLALSTTYYSFLKLWNRRDINVFDLIQIFSTLYFVLIPTWSIIRSGIDGNFNFIELFESHPITLLVFINFSVLLLLINFIWTTQAGHRISILNISKYFRILDKNFDVDVSMLYLSLFVFLTALYPLVNYSSLTNDNIEGNLTFRYALNVPLYQRMIIAMVYNSLPFFLLVTIKFIRSKQIRYRKLSYYILILQIITLLLGVRTFLFYNIVFIIFYIYSVERRFFTFKKVVIGLLTISIVINFIFPLSLMLRFAKQEQVLYSTKHSFFDVVTALDEMSSSDLYDLIENSEETTQRRSLGVYSTLDAVVYKSYNSTNGQLFLDQIKTIIPIIKNNEEFSNIVGSKIGFGGDVAESIIAYFFFDYSWFGIYLSGIFIFIFIFISKFLADFFYLIFREKKVYFILVISVLSFCINTEMVPSIRSIYNPGILVYTTFYLIMLIFNQLRKDRKYNNFSTKKRLMLSRSRSKLQV